MHPITPADTFPYASNLSRHKQLDPTQPYDHAAPPGTGQSRIGNYGPLTGFHHRLKTHGRWQVTQPYPGIYLWRDTHGATYLVDHTGTRRVGRCVRVRAGRTRCPPHRAGLDPRRLSTPDRVHSGDLTSR